MGVTEHRGFEGLSGQKTNVDDILSSLNIEESEKHDDVKKDHASESVSVANEVSENTKPEQKTKTKNVWLWVAAMVFIAFVIGQMGSTSVTDEPVEDYTATEDVAPSEEQIAEPGMEEAAESAYNSMPVYEDPIYSEPVEEVVPYESEPYDNGYSDNYGQNSDNSY